MINLDTITLELLINTYNALHYPLLPINICGIRSSDTDANTFNDVIAIFTNKNVLAVRGTTDAGLPYRLDPLSDEGTGILPTGFHRNIWNKGLHQGKYEALVQRNQCRVIRDNNKDSVLDSVIPDYAICVETGKTYYDHSLDWNTNKYITGLYHFQNISDSYTVEVGYFGINLHHAHSVHTLTEVNKFSAGCQVIQNIDDYNSMLKILYTKRDPYSYALINETDLIIPT